MVSYARTQRRLMYQNVRNHLLLPLRKTFIFFNDAEVQNYELIFGFIPRWNINILGTFACDVALILAIHHIQERHQVSEWLYIC